MHASEKRKVRNSQMTLTHFNAKWVYHTHSTATCPNHKTVDEQDDWEEDPVQTPVPEIIADRLGQYDEEEEC